MQYDMTPPRTGTGIVAGDTVKMVQKWRIHFAKPPKSSTLAALAKPVTTGVLVRNLELDEEAVRFSSFSFSFTCHLIIMRTWDRTNIEAFHRSVRSQNSALVRPHSDLAVSQFIFGAHRFPQDLH